MQSAKDAREARRKKIMERGADRLAFITGEIKSVPKSTEPFINTVDQGQECTRETNGGVSKESPIDRLTDINDESSVEVANVNGTSVGPQSTQLNARITSNITELGIERDSSTFRSPDSFSSACHVEHKNKPPSSSLFSDFTLSRFIYAIEASRGARILCAVVIAVLLVSQTVLLSHNNPLSGVLEPFVPPWPVLTILVMDVTLVLATMLMTNKNSNLEDNTDHTSEDTYSTFWNMASKVGDLLQSVYVLVRVIDAMSMDCSIFAVVLVCGLSLARYWF
eukprot:Gb_19272 [translate_table: standard]